MPFGSVFSKFSRVELTTADEVFISFKNTFLSRLAFKILGMPHIGIRLRGKKIIKNLPNRKRTINKMLDAGCGTGIYSFTLVSSAKKIDAVDIAPEKIKYAKSVNFYKNINFQRMDICNLNFNSNTFDLITCSDVIEHIKNDKKAFSELSRVLKKKGTLLITVPYDSKKNRKEYKKYGHERPGYSEKVMQGLCENNNLKLIKAEKYSYNLTEKISELNYKISNSHILLGILFYPLYFSALIAESLFKKEPNGIFFLIRKN